MEELLKDLKELSKKHQSVRGKEDIIAFLCNGVLKKDFNKYITTDVVAEVKNWRWIEANDKQSALNSFNRG